jgi:hypothetical protein
MLLLHSQVAFGVLNDDLYGPSRDGERLSLGVESACRVILLFCMMRGLSYLSF